jgi:hypothetical protein
VFPKPTLIELIGNANASGKLLLANSTIDIATANLFRLANLTNRQIFELLSTETADRVTQEGIRLKAVSNNFEFGTFVGSGAGTTRGLSIGTYPLATPTTLTKWMQFVSNGEIGIYGPSILRQYRYSDDAVASVFTMRKYRGTESAPTSLLTNDVIGQLLFQGYNGATITSLAAVQAQATADFTTTSGPTRLLFNTTSPASIGSSVRMVITEDGRVSIGTWSTATPLAAQVTLIGNNSGGAENNTLRFHDLNGAITTGNTIGKIEFYSGDASAPGVGVKAWIASLSEGVSAANAAIVFATDTNTGTPIERMRIKATGVTTFEKLHGSTTEVTYTPTGTTQTIPLDSGTMQTLALTSTTGATTATLTVPTIASARGSIIVKQHGTTARNIVWAVSAGTIKWLGTQPTWSSDAINAVRDVRWRWDGSVMYLDASAAG